MKAIRCDLPYAETIEIHPMADLHIGDSSSDYKSILERIDYIKKTDNAYCILDGDLMDTAIASSVGDTYGANLQPKLYTIYVTNGSGGGRREGGKINRLADLASIVDADIYVHAHTHLPVVFKEAFFRVSGSNSSVSLVDKLFVNSAASLNYGGYGDRQGFKPASKQSPVIYLHGTKRNMWAKL